MYTSSLGTHTFFMIVLPALFFFGNFEIGHGYVQCILMHFQADLSVFKASDRACLWRICLFRHEGFDLLASSFRTPSNSAKCVALTVPTGIIAESVDSHRHSSSGIWISFDAFHEQRVHRPFISLSHTSSCLSAGFESPNFRDNLLCIHCRAHMVHVLDRIRPVVHGHAQFYGLCRGHPLGCHYLGATRICR